MKTPKILYLCNAFSLQMLDLSLRHEVEIEPVRCSKINDKWLATIGDDLVDIRDIESSIGHPDIANLLGVKMNRTSTHLFAGDTILVAQYIGGRLPEGVTSLPEGAEIQFVLLTVKFAIDITSFLKLKEELKDNIRCSISYGDEEIYSSVKSTCMSILRSLEQSPSATIEALKEFLGVKDE